MTTTQQERKQEGLRLLQKMDIFRPYINGYKCGKSKICFFANYGGFWVYQEPEIEQKIKEIEQAHNCTVYAVTHEYTEFGELWDFLCVTENPEEWNGNIYTQGDKHTIFAYTYNKTDDLSSEFGYITVRAYGGGIKRIA